MRPYTTQEYNPVATKYTIGISNKENLIDQQRNTIDIKPGNEVLVNVIPRLVKTTVDFNGLKRKQRKCKLPHESDGFSFLKQYSRIGCEFECAVKRVVSKCKCIPWFYPKQFTAFPVCEMFGGNCFETLMSDDRYYRQCKAQCWTDCHETAYIVYTSSTPLNLDTACNARKFHHKHFEENLRKHFAFHNYKTLVEGGSIPNLMESFENGSLCKSYIKNYVAFVRVEGPSSLIISTNKDKSVFLPDKIGNIGSTLGLFLGISAISFFEMGFLLLNLARAVIIRWNIDPMNGQHEKQKIDGKIEKLEYNVQVSL